MNSKLEKVLKLTKPAAKALYFINENGAETSTAQIQSFLSCTRAKALAAIKELKEVYLVEVYNDINATYGDRTRGYKVTAR
jgi:hypothetical protein